MRNIPITLLILIYSLVVNAQENKLLIELSKIESGDHQVFHIIKNPISNLKNNDLIISLKKKLKSELNTIHSCVNSYGNIKELKLNEKEISELKRRIEQISSRFYELNKYTLIKTPNGIAPIYGVGIDTISNKKVIVVYLGGGCNVTEADKRRNEITAVFNEKMKSLLKN